MICRLCLIKCEDFRQIFGESPVADLPEIASLIKKYFRIELQQQDAISNKICTDCWNHLHEFEKFCQNIDQKQETLVNIKCDLEMPFEEPIDIKDITLCEPEIFIHTGEQVSDEVKEFAAAVESVLEAASLKDDAIAVAQLPGKKSTKARAKRKYTKMKSKISLEVEDSEDDVTDDDDADYMPDIGAAEPRTKRKYTKRKAKEAVADKQEKEDELMDEMAPAAVDGSEMESTDARPKRKYTKRKGVTSMEKPKTVSEKHVMIASISREMDAYIAQNVKLSCCLCSQSLEHFDDLKRHFRKDHQCIGYIPCCNTRFKKRALYVDHLKLHENPDLFKCFKCNKNLASRNCYYHHMALRHPGSSELKFQCEICSQKFAKQYILDVHMKRHNEVTRDHICELCNKSYRTLHDLKTHKSRVHLNEFSAMCDICGKNFKTKQNFELHMSYIHENNSTRQEVQCKICGHWLKDKRSLFKHMYKHQDEASGKEFVCSECGAVKQTRVKLFAHIRYHHPKVTHKCTLCGKEFKRTRCLKEHMATHTGKDLYSCEYCSQTFKSHANAHNHKKKMHPSKWIPKYSQPSKPVINTNVVNSEDVI